MSGENPGTPNCEGNVSFTSRVHASTSGHCNGTVGPRPNRVVTQKKLLASVGQLSSVQCKPQFRAGALADTTVYQKVYGKAQRAPLLEREYNALASRPYCPGKPGQCLQTYWDHQLIENVQGRKEGVTKVRMWVFDCSCLMQGFYLPAFTVSIIRTQK